MELVFTTLKTSMQQGGNQQMSSNVFRKYGIKAGLERHYDKPFPIEQPIPSVHELVLNHAHKFITGFPGNAEGLVWITRQKLSEENYRSFIYAMAIYAQSEEYNPNRADSWQFHHNLRKISNKIRNKHISLAGAELLVMNYMLGEMADQSRCTRDMYLSSLIKDLEKVAGSSVVSC